MHLPKVRRRCHGDHGRVRKGMVSLIAILIAFATVLAIDAGPWPTPRPIATGAAMPLEDCAAPVELTFETIPFDPDAPAIAATTATACPAVLRAAPR